MVVGYTGELCGSGASCVWEWGEVCGSGARCAIVGQGLWGARCVGRGVVWHEVLCGTWGEVWGERVWGAHRSRHCLPTLPGSLSAIRAHDPAPFSLTSCVNK